MRSAPDFHIVEKTRSPSALSDRVGITTLSMRAASIDQLNIHPKNRSRRTGTAIRTGMQSGETDLRQW